MTSSNSPPTTINDLQSRAFTLFEQSLDQPDDQRDEWIRQHCGDDVALAAAVARLIAADRASDGYLESPALMPVDHQGERIGAFILEAELGAGGMGRVYRAHRADGRFAQDVAIKLFDAGGRDPDALGRFESERRILASLEHPGIARLIDGGTAGDGTPWVAMELVRGQTITHYCQQQRLGVADRAALFIKVCDALEAAHAIGIVHRDIKPGNVLVDDNGQPRLIDFGIAKVLDARLFDAEMPSTSTIGAPLTPEYASPEQVRGEPVTTASDVYSMGILLYELLTGTRPYRLTNSSTLELERTICLSIPPDPSDRVARSGLAALPGLPESRSLRRLLRGDLDRIVMTALRKDASERYPSAAALGRDLERHLTGQPVTARGASRWYRATRFVQRHRFASAATAVAFAILATGLIAVSVQSIEVRRQADRAEAARDFLTAMIMRADPFEAAAEPTLAGALRASLVDIDTRFAGQPKLEADMRYAIGYALQNLGEVDEARTQISKALSMRELDGTALEQAEALDGLGLIDWWDSDPAAAEKRFNLALERIGDDRSPVAIKLRVDILANLGAMLSDAGEYARSAEFSRRAQQAAEQSSDIDLATLATIQGNLGNALSEVEGEGEASLAAFHRGLELQRKATGENHPNYAILLNNLAFALAAMERRDEAIDALEQSVAIRRKTLGSTHPQTATALSNLAALYVAAGRLNEAEPLAKEALVVAEGGYEAGHPRIGKAHEKLAQLYAASGDVTKARDHAQQALAMYRAAPSVDPAWIAAAQGILDGLPPTGKATTSP